MSVVKKYNTKKYKKKNPYKKRVKIYGRAGLQLWRDVNYLKGLINTEPKTHVVTDANNFSSAGVIISLANVPNGDSDITRDGNRILPRYLTCKIAIGGATALMAATSGTTVFARFMIVRSWVDNATAAGNLTVAEVLDTTLSQFAPFSPLNSDISGPRRDRTRRIEVLRSELFEYNNTGSAYHYIRDFNLEMNQGANNAKEHIEYVSTATAEPNSGGIYAIFISNSLTGTYSQYQIMTKLTFYDN